MSKKIKADMGKLEEIQTILENNAKKITHNITRIGELHKEIDVCWESQMWDSCYKTYCDLKKELEENAKEYEEYPKKLKACIEESGIAGKCFKVTEKKRGQYKWRNYM